MYIPATDNVVKGYEIASSLRFNDNDSAYLSRTPASAGNRKTWTWAGWVKRGNLNLTTSTLFQGGNNASNTEYARIWFDSLDRLRFSYYSNFWLITTQVFRDVSAYYHIMVKFDTTESIASDRIKLYVNGEQVTSFDTEAYPAQNSDQGINLNDTHYVGASFVTASITGYLDGYLADVHFIDGQALGPENFGETGDYGEWKPIQYTGSYGTNGFYLDFKASGSLGNDASPNGNDWTPTNLAATDQMLDTPTNNFAVMSPVFPTQSQTFEEGNLEVATPVAGGGISIASIGVSSGKWYAEFTAKSQTLANAVACGICEDIDSDRSSYLSVEANDHEKTISTGDIIGVALDADGDQVTFYVNNVAGTPISLAASKEWFFAVSDEYGNHSGVLGINFGQDSSFAGNKTAQGNTDDNGNGDFYYSPPSGYLALCTDNLADPTVVPSEHFSTELYTGTGSNIAITGVGYAPDLVWIKRRSAAADHVLFDKIRGIDTWLRSNTTDADTVTAGGFPSFDSDGFTVGVGSSRWNGSGDTYVAWNWKANGAGVSNTDGSITSTVSANVDAGFSIVSYTGNGTGGATVGHGLSKKPELILTKGRTAATNWVSYSEEITANKYLLLNLTSAELTSAGAFNNTEPTASVFSVGTFGDINGNGTNFIAYAFHSVAGFSKFGSYTGNGSTDGPFVYCGFRPKMIIIKSTSAVGNWVIWDTERDTYNVADRTLFPNGSNAEETGNVNEKWDILSNGFKLRSNGRVNPSGVTHIFMAFAENPFKNTNAR